MINLTGWHSTYIITTDQFLTFQMFPRGNPPTFSICRHCNVLVTIQPTYSYQNLKHCPKPFISETSPDKRETGRKDVWSCTEDLRKYLHIYKTSCFNPD